MPNILNLPDDAQHFFPAHGWIESESGVRHLRLPILRAFRYGQLGFAKLQRLPNAGALGQFVSLPSTLRLLGLALRDLHDQILIVKANADAAFFDKEPSPARDEAFNRQRESIEHSEVLLIAAFTLLRRLGDDLMYGLRPILFEHWRSAPPKLPEAIKLAESGKLSGLKPYCDVDSLERNLIDKTEWLGLLRDKGGIRDILVHKQHMLGMGVSGTRPENSEHTIWRVYANLSVLTGDGVQNIPVLSLLKKCIAEACVFMASLTPLIGGATSYGPEDCMVLCGSRNSAIGFWPAIRGGIFEFPFF